MKFNVLDIETTGLSNKDDEIIEIGAVKFDKGVAVARLTLMFKPLKELSAESQLVHKITPAMLVNCPPIEKDFYKVKEFCGADPIIGHNFPNFDIHFFNKVIEEKGIEGPTGDVFCSHSLAKQLFPKDQTKIINLKLITLLTYYKIDFKPSELHRAENDCYYNGLLVIKMMEELGISSFEELGSILKVRQFVKPRNQMSFF